MQAVHQRHGGRQQAELEPPALPYGRKNDKIDFGGRRARAAFRINRLHQEAIFARLQVAVIHFMLRARFGPGIVCSGQLKG